MGWIGGGHGKGLRGVMGTGRRPRHRELASFQISPTDAFQSSCLSLTHCQQWLGARVIKMSKTQVLPSGSTQSSSGDRPIHCVAEVAQGLSMYSITRPQRAPQSEGKGQAHPIAKHVGKRQKLEYSVRSWKEALEQGRGRNFVAFLALPFRACIPRSLGSRYIHG